MPRPKVHPNNRQRAAEACDFCRVSKKRCSATVPCTNCVKRGKAESCRLSRNAKDSNAIREPQFRSPPRPTASNSGEHGRLEPTTPTTVCSGRGRVTSNGWDNGRPSPISNSPQTSNTTLTSQDGQAGATRRLSSGAELHPRMLLNRSGDRMFIGESASISFLQLVRDTVSENLGPSQFSHNDKVDTMLEAQPLLYNESCPSPDFFSDEVSSYFDVYCASTTGLIDILSPTEFNYLCRAGGEAFPNTLPFSSTIRDLIFAIGAQCLSLASSQNAGERYFRRAQLAVFATMLEDPSIDMVRIFLLMSFYMLGQCRRNTAYMYLGIATRAATSIGLHSSEPFTKTSDPDTQLSTQVWMSLCNIDILVSSILGRPPATSGLRLDVEKHPVEVAEVSALESTPVLASSQILVLINEVVNRIYVNKDNSIATAEELLERVEKWSRNLPKSLNNHKTASGGTDQRKTIAEMHVSCLYYYAVTLITRPVLVSALTSGSGSTGSQLALACLDAAVFLVQTCMNVHNQGLLIGNMCFIKALVFASGLILGFALFVEQKFDQELDAAFDGAQNVLSFLSTQSPQAAHYLDILSLLSRAIASKRSKQARGRSKYVGKLFAQDEERHAASHSSNNENLISTGNGQKSGLDDALLSLNSEMLPSILDGVDVEMPFDWDILEISRWDSFPCFEPREFHNE